ncbi:MAG: threonine ammonia-lyase [Sciscionella sp.]
MRMVTIDDISRAAARIRGAVAVTPLLACPWADDERPLWLKPENLQPVGAFKLRGAWNAIALLPASARARGVVAYSSGNHAQAVAYAARHAGVPSVIVVDDSAPATKIEATRSHGAEVITVPLAEREAVAHRVAAERGASLIPPFDAPEVIAGQGTIGVELLADLPDLDVVLVPVSGGGLASGIGVAVKALRPQAKVIGVEPELAADTRDGLLAGHRVDWPVEQRRRTIADGLRAQPSELTFAHLSSVLEGMVTVSESEIHEAVRCLALRSHIVAEPSGAVATAAYLHRTAELPPGRTVAVVSGGNIDRALLAEILS